MDQALRALARVGLIDTRPGGEEQAVVVHPLIAATNRAHLLSSVGGQRDDVYRTAITLVAGALASIRWALPGDWPRLRQLTPHVHALLDVAAPHLDAERLAMLIEAASDAAAAHHWSGDLPVAISLTTEALRCASALTTDHPAVLRARFQLAYETGRLGNWAAAEAALHDVLAAQRRVLGDDHSDTLATWPGRWPTRGAGPRPSLHIVKFSPLSGGCSATTTRPLSTPGMN